MHYYEHVLMIELTVWYFGTFKHSIHHVYVVIVNITDIHECRVVGYVRICASGEKKGKRILLNRYVH